MCHRSTNTSSEADTFVKSVVLVNILISDLAVPVQAQRIAGWNPMVLPGWDRNPDSIRPQAATLRLSFAPPTAFSGPEPFSRALRR